MSEIKSDNRPTQCGVVITQEELENIQKHYLDLGNRMGKQEFNWREFITGLLIGIGAATVLILLSK